MKDPFVRGLIELAAQDPKIFLITADLGFGAFEGFQQQFPRQFLNVGVAEQSMACVATGLALEGRTVFIYSIANFSTLRCLEQIRNDAAYHDANVKIVAMGGGFSYGALGFSHHATEDLSVMRSLPVSPVIAPSDDWEAYEATKALAYAPGTAYLRLDKTSAPDHHADGEKFEIGKARVLQDGSDFTLIATGGIVTEALTAAKNLRESGVHCRVLSMHTVKPVDREAVLKAAQETGGILTIEEGTVNGGLGDSIAALLMEANAVPNAFHRIGLRAKFATIVGNQSFLREKYGMDSYAIATKVHSLVKSRTGHTISARPLSRLDEYPLL